MGYKMCTPGVQIFLGYEKAKWGIVPPNGVHMAALLMSYNKGYTRIMNIICWVNFFNINLAKDSGRVKPILCDA